MTTPQDPFSTPPERGGSSPQPPSAPPPSGPAWGAPAPGAAGADAPASGGYGDGYGATAGPDGGAYGAPGGRPQGTSNGLGIASLVLGLLGLFTSFFVIGGLLGILAIVLGVLGLGKVKRGEASGKGMPIAGIILGALSILIAGAVIALGAWFVNSDAGQELADCLEEAGGDTAAQAECQRQFEDTLTQ